MDVLSLEEVGYAEKALITIGHTQAMVCLIIVALAMQRLLQFVRALASAVSEE
jgi:hypothetical protein